MKTFKQIRKLTERRSFKYKGWIHPEKRVIYMHGNEQPYHIGMVMSEPTKFGLNPRKIAEIWGENYSKNKDEVDEKIDLLKYGGKDVDMPVENYLKSQGWCRFYIDEYAFAFDSENMRDVKNAVKYFFEKNPALSTEMGGRLYSETKAERFDSMSDLIRFIRTGRKVQRTEIGRTMAQFR